MKIEIDIARQELRFGKRTYPVSTAKKGAGEINGWVTSVLDLASIRIGFVGSTEYFLNS